MSMVFCRACGAQLHETAPTCPRCGAPQAVQGEPEPRRTFGNSVSICLRKYAVFRGRAPRAELWFYVLFNLILGVVAAILDSSAFHHAAVFTILVDLGLLLPSLAVQVRRLHDLDRSGWWLLIGFIPLVGVIVLLVWFCTRGTRGPNRFGPDPLAGEFRAAYATS